MLSIDRLGRPFRCCPVMPAVAAERGRAQLMPSQPALLAQDRVVERAQLVKGERVQGFVLRA